MDRFRVAYASESDTYGGAERYLIALLEHLDRDAYEPCYIGPPGTPDRIMSSLADLDVPFVALRRITGKSDIAGLLSTNRTLRDLAPDILHVNLSNPLHGQYAMLAGRFAGIPVRFATMHLPPRSSTATRRGRWFERQTLGDLDRLIAVSDDSRDLILRHMNLPHDRVVTVHNGINPEDFSCPVLSDQDPDTFHIGTVGRLVEQKGFIHLIDAIPQVLVTVPNVHLSLAGEGPLAAELKARVDALGIRDHVSFLGQRTDIPKLLTSFDLFVLPSLYESFPFTTLEAMAAGRAVVSTEVDGIPESVVHGETGLLIPPQDPPALARAIVALLTERDRCRAMGVAGRARVERNFTLKLMYTRVDRLYRECLPLNRECPPQNRECLSRLTETDE